MALSAESRPAHPRRGVLAAMLAVAIGAVLLLVSMVWPAPLGLPGGGSGDFSVGRALRDLQFIAFAPHPAGSSRQAEVAAYLQAELEAAGWETERQPARAESSGESVDLDNVVGRISGSGSTGTIVLLAHYHSYPEAPGAADNASGSAAVLEAARVLANDPPQEKRPVGSLR